MVNIGVLFSLLPPAFCPHVLQGTTPLFLLPSMLDIVSASCLVCFYFFLMEAENIVFGSSQGTLAAISSPLQLSL